MVPDLLEPDGAVVYAVDPLTLWGEDAPLRVPPGPARVVSYAWPGDQSSTGLALVWGTTGTVTCGEMVAVIGVDTGLAAFMDAPALAEVTRLEEGSAAYAAYFNALVEMGITGEMIAIEEATFPASRSGYGDGGYGVWQLSDESGTIRALWVEFLPGGEDWADFPACPL